MKIFWTLARRELAAYFLSVTGYVIIAAATFLIGLGFVVLINGLGNQPSAVPVTELFYQTPYFWLIVLLGTPVITMRLLAQEKSSGTYETLMTTAVRDVQVVAAKFAAALVFYMVMWLPMLAALFIVSRFTAQQGTLDAGTVGGMFLGVFLVGCLFLAAGCFTSALTRSQMAAAMIAFVVGVALFSFGYLALAIPSGAPQWEARVIAYFNIFDQMDSFARGIVDTRVVILYASLALCFLFLTLRVVESRRWK